MGASKARGVNQSDGKIAEVEVKPGSDGKKQLLPSPPGSSSS